MYVPFPYGSPYSFFTFYLNEKGCGIHILYFHFIHTRNEDKSKISARLSMLVNVFQLSTNKQRNLAQFSNFKGATKSGGGSEALQP